MKGVVFACKRLDLVWLGCHDHVEITAQSSVAENTALNQYCYAKCIDIAFFYA